MALPSDDRLRYVYERIARRLAVSVEDVGYVLNGWRPPGVDADAILEEAREYGPIDVGDAR